MTLSLERVKRRCEVISPAHHPLLIPAATEAAPFISFPVKLEKSPEGFSELLGRGTLRRMTTANDICNAVLGGLQRDYEAVHTNEVRNLQTKVVGSHDTLAAMKDL